MKRSTLVAVVLATLSTGTAMAQSTVTVYGRLNITLENEKVSGTKATNNVNNNSSRIGFKGTEDLGGGLKAGFVLEHGFNPDTGTASNPTRFWARESTVWIGSNTLGSIHLGNLPASTAYYATADYVSLHNHDTGTSADALYSFVATGQFQNAIGYKSPTFGGAVFEIQTAERIAGERPIAASINHDAGPLHLGLGYEKLGDAKSLALRALYEMGPFTFGGYYERGSGSNEVNNFRLAGMYTMGAGEFHLNFGMRGDTNDVPDTGAKQFTVAYNHNLSKRTKVYTYYTRLDPDFGGYYRSLAVGVRHNF
jgi:predicted porin